MVNERGEELVGEKGRRRCWDETEGRHWLGKRDGRRWWTSGREREQGMRVRRRDISVSETVGCRR